MRPVVFIAVAWVCGSAWAPAPAVASSCVSGTPAGVAQWVYRNDPQLMKARPAVSPRLAGLMRQERACIARTREVCALDWDFWTASQEGRVVGNPRFEEATQDAARATVRMKFWFSLEDDGRNAAETTTTIQLVRDRPDGCWAVDDIVDPQGGSLKAALSRN